MKQLEADVVVVAAGASGLAATVAAAEGGASVTTFEKASTTGGAGSMGMGIFAVESRLQRLMQVPLSREDAFKIHMNYTHWRVDARLVKAYIDKSASTVEWLEGMGVAFHKPSPYFTGSNFTWHIVRQPDGQMSPGCAGTMVKILTERAKALGARIFLQTPVNKILREGGNIAGVVAEDSAGEPVQTRAKAVIIATGGFGDNPEMIKKYTGYEWGKNLFTFRIPGLNGDGLRMAWEAGAAPGEMSMHAVCGLPAPLAGPGGTDREYAAFRQPGLMVNLQGERFMSEEEIGNTPFWYHAVDRQKDHCGFMLLDADTRKYYEEVRLDYLQPVFPDTRSVDLEAAIKRAGEQGYEHLFTAGSLEELCAQTGISPDGLRGTLEEYNRSCENGRDELFHKSAKYLRPVRQPPFYAGRFFPGGYGSLGGIRINEKAEVLNKNREVIPGLYAAGNDANSLYGGSYIFYLPGNTMGFAVNSGRIAGENAARYAGSLK